MARGPVKVLTPEEIDAKIKELKEQLKEAKAHFTSLKKTKRYQETLDPAIASLDVPRIFKDITAKTGASKITILAAIGKAAKIPRLVITQKDVVPRAKKAK